MYMGILRSEDTQSEIFPDLQIITPEQFSRVQKGREQRAADYEEKCAAAWETAVTLADQGETSVVRPPRTCPKRNAGKTLLSGNIFCGHCGGRIFASTARKSHHPTSAEKAERIAIYKCYNRSQHKQNCDVPSTCQAEKVDAVVDQLIRNIFSRAKAGDEREFIKKQVASTSAQYQRLLSWADLYDASTEEKRMIASYVVKVVTLSRGYDIQIDLNISEAQYLNGIELQ